MNKIYLTQTSFIKRDEGVFIRLNVKDEKHFREVQITDSKGDFLNTIPSGLGKLMLASLRRLLAISEGE